MSLSSTDATSFPDYFIVIFLAIEKNVALADKYYPDPQDEARIDTTETIPKTVSVFPITFSPRGELLRSYVANYKNKQERQ